MTPPPTTDSVSMRPRQTRLRRLLVTSAAPAAAIVGLMLLSDRLFEPAHGRGVAQGLLGLLNRLSRLLEVPGQFLLWGVVNRLPYLSRLTHYPHETFLVLSLLFYAAAFAFLIGLNARLS